MIKSSMAGTNVKVRIAPSPTGIPHIGNTRTALYNFLWAKKNKGKFLLRIEDTDQKRVVAGARDAIIEILDWLELSPDEIYAQSERLDIYKKHIKILLNKNIAYEKEGADWIKIPKDREFSWIDAIGNKNITFQSNVVEDFVAIKSDGFPTYHFASVVDDYLMEITHVIRGDEWISSTPKHLFLYESFGWKAPIFAHLPVILGPDRSKLSKRHGAESALDYRDKGFLKEALLNFMALLGWSPGGDREIMDVETMVDLFDLKDINTGSPVFDIKKLEWMNGVYIRKLAVSELVIKLKEYALELNLTILPDEKLFKLVELAQPRINTLKDFFKLVEPLISLKEESLSKEEIRVAQDTIKEFSKLPNWDKETILNTLRELMKKNDVRMPIFYKIITGRKEGLPLPEIIELLGKQEILERLKKNT